MKKNLSIRLLATAVLVSSIAVFTACDTSQSDAGKTIGTNGANGGYAAMSVRDVYAMSAISGVSYLSEGEFSAQSVGGMQGDSSAILAAATSRPQNVADSDVAGIKNCLAVFDNLLLNGGIDQTVQENSSADTRFGAYAWEMHISTPVGDGTFEGLTLYFNELNKTATSELDDGVEEKEERTTLEGVLLYGEELFVIKGVKEIETEGKEVETSLEFKTYRNVGVESVQADESNFVVLSQSTEQGELEYEYAFYQNGHKVQEIELDFEQNRRGVELSFQIKDLSNRNVQETEYELRKKGNGFVVEFEKNGKEQKISIALAEEGYTFTYSNGFVESVK